jgi:hypothetical protein
VNHFDRQAGMEEERETMRRAARTDFNQAEIVEGLRRAGCEVVSLAAVGKGVPDLLCSRAGRNFLLEVKDPEQPLSKRRLTPEQQIFHTRWQGPCVVVETVEQALKAVGVLR